MVEADPAHWAINPWLAASVVASAVAGCSLARRAGSPVALVGGLVVMAIAWLSPLATLAEAYLASAHLVQVTLTMGFAAPMLLLAMPERRDTTRSRWRHPWESPWCGLLVMHCTFFAWHAAGPFNAALVHPWLYALQQWTLMIGAAVFWLPIIRPRPAAAMSGLGMLGYIVLATVPQTLGGLTIALIRHPLYTSYGNAGRILGLSPLTDQEIAGACAAILGKIALFAAFTVIFFRLLRDPAGSGEDDDHGGTATPQGSPPLAGRRQPQRLLLQPHPRGHETLPPRHRLVTAREEPEPGQSPASPRRRDGSVR